MDDRGAVLAAAGDRAAALAARDAGALRDLMHEDLRWTTHRGQVLDRDGYVRANTEGRLRWIGQQLVGAEVVLHGDTAVLTAVVVDDVDAGSGQQRFTLRLTQTWVRRHGRWQCLSGHAGPSVDAPLP